MMLEVVGVISPSTQVSSLTSKSVAMRASMS